MSKSVKVLADATTNVSDETWAAWTQHPIQVIRFGGNTLSRVFSFGLHNFAKSASRARKVSRDPEKLTPSQAQTMTTDPDDWRLVVSYGDDSSKVGVLDKAQLVDAYDHGTGSGTATARLRAMQDAEEVQWNDAKAQAAPSRSLGDVKTAVALPVTNLATLAVVGGGFGIATVPVGVAIARPWSAVVGAIAGAIALMLSFSFAAGLHREDVRLSRLDLLESLQPAGRWLTRIPAICAVLWTIAIAGLFYAVVPASGTKEPAKATFGPPQITTANDGTRTVELTVTWEHLSDDVAQVVTTVNGTGVKAERAYTADKNNDGTATVKVDRVTTHAPTTMTVTSQPVTEKGEAVGNAQTSKPLRIP